MARQNTKEVLTETDAGFSPENKRYKKLIGISNTIFSWVHYYKYVDVCALL